MRNLKIEVFAAQDECPVRGNAGGSGDENEDRAWEDEILGRLESGDVWAWASVEVRATCPGCGESGSDYLGCCTFESEEHFRKSEDFTIDGAPHGYFQDMQAEAIANCRNACQCIEVGPLDLAIAFDAIRKARGS